MLDMPYFPIVNSQCAPKDIVILMTNLFHIYDRLIDLHECYKVLSIMDCYFIIAGVPKFVPDHADKILNLALGLVMEAKQIMVPQLNVPVLVSLKSKSHSLKLFLLLFAAKSCSTYGPSCGRNIREDKNPLWRHG